VLATAYLSHGDTKHILLFPSSVSECFDFAGEAFNLAERFQTPVFVMSDLDLGMNNWMSEPFRYPEKPMDRGKVLTKADLERLGSFARYKDVDGDGIGWRTLPGTDHPAAAYFTRGSGHNANALYSERSDEYQSNLDRLARKFETAKRCVPQPVIEGDGAKIGLLAYGTTHWAMVESRDQLRDEHGIETDYLRVRAFPFSSAVEDFVRRHERVYVVEHNRDGQLFDLLKIELPAELVSRLQSLARIDGLPADARTITDEITQKEGK
jgi:2-oxoglutarate ferredoxin oxidoreductase subunit alpha